MLEEKPQVEEIEGNIITRKAFSGAEAEHVTFSYEDEVILDDYSLQIQPGKILGIHGASGSGKSTLINEILYKGLANQLYRSSGMSIPEVSK